MRTSLLIVAVAFLCGCTASPPGAAPVSLEFRLAQSEPAEGLTEMTVRGSDRKVYVRNDVVLSNADVASASVSTNFQNLVTVQIAFTKLGGKKLTHATEANINNHIAILVDGNVVSAPLVRAKIMGRRAEISGSFTAQEATRIAEGIVPR
jgi:preprotein translocase subunit SecD